MNECAAIHHGIQPRAHATNNIIIIIIIIVVIVIVIVIVIAFRLDVADSCELRLVGHGCTCSGMRRIVR